MKSSSVQQRAFTLIELLVVIAIIAILAAILFPVFAQAKAAAKFSTSLSNVKQIATASIMYSGDSDDMVIFYYDRNMNYSGTDTWPNRLLAYTKNQDLFFDAMTAKPVPDKAVNGVKQYYNDNVYSGYAYSWAWITNLSINADGYSVSSSGNCQGVENTDRGATRSQTAIEQPAERLAFGPTQYSTKNSYGWLYFTGWHAAWPTADVYVQDYNDYNLVWDARSRYRTAKFVGSYADGHAAKFGSEKFIKYYNNSANGTTEASNRGEWCTAFANRKLDAFWGAAWSAN